MIQYKKIACDITQEAELEGFTICNHESTPWLGLMVALEYVAIFDAGFPALMSGCRWEPQASSSGGDLAAHHHTSERLRIEFKEKELNQ